MDFTVILPGTCNNKILINSLRLVLIQNTVGQEFYNQVQTRGSTKSEMHFNWSNENFFKKLFRWVKLVNIVSIKTGIAIFPTPELIKDIHSYLQP
jgi:hypothetical protein